MAKRWRVGIAGLGHWYSAFGLARAFPEYPKAELVAVAWPDAAQLDEFARTFGIEGTPTYDELLARDDVDIVHIAPPVADIPDLTIKAARAGKHIVLGKPMAMTVAEADEMVAAVRASGVSCVPFQGAVPAAPQPTSRRGSTPARSATSPCCTRPAAGRSPRTGTARARPGWFADPAKVPGGAFIDEGIYWTRPVPLAGRQRGGPGRGARWPTSSTRTSRVEDWGFATFTFANGIIATLEASWTINAPTKTGPSPKHNAFRQLQMVGTRGEIVETSLREPSLGCWPPAPPAGTSSAGCPSPTARRRRRRSTT